MKYSLFIMFYICLGLAGCTHEDLSQKNIHKGYYWREMEQIAFVPLCKNVKWWISWDLKSDREFGKKGVWDKYPVYMVIEGSVSEKGKWGHLGGYPRMITINKLIYYDEKEKYHYLKNRKKCE